jgi:hypothetical protein
MAVRSFKLDQLFTLLVPDVAEISNVGVFSNIPDELDLVKKFLSILFQDVY